MFSAVSWISCMISWQPSLILFLTPSVFPWTCFDGITDFLRSMSRGILHRCMMIHKQFCLSLIEKGLSWHAVFCISNMLSFMMGKPSRNQIIEILPERRHIDSWLSSGRCWINQVNQSGNYHEYFCHSIRSDPARILVPDRHWRGLGNKPKSCRFEMW